MLEIKQIAETPDEIKTMIHDLLMRNCKTYEDYEVIVVGTTNPNSYVVYTNEYRKKFIEQAIENERKISLEINGKEPEFNNLPIRILYDANFVVIDGKVEKNRFGYHTTDEKNRYTEFKENA